MGRTGFLTSDRFLDHDPGDGHPERPHRLESLYERLDRDGLLKEFELLEPVPAEQAWLRAVHPLRYLDALRDLQSESRRKGKPCWIDADTACGPRSFDTALLAAGGVMSAVDAVIEGRVRSAFCAVRPPGHHAEPDRAMGFCLINNVAVAARYLVEKHGLERVLILDWDVHHGNGTQAAFYEDPSVYYISTHQFGIYPGTGSPRERGSGDGEGTNRNLLLESGDGDTEMLARFDGPIREDVESWKPEFVLVSAGFDAHEADPLAGLRVTRRGFEEMTLRVRDWAESWSGGRIVSVLEGGYDLEALASSVEGHILTLAAD